MSIELTCPVCSRRHRAEADTVRGRYCSIACFNRGLGYDNPDYQAGYAPSRHDAVTITCPVCQHTFTPAGRQKFCSDACRAAAYRRRRDAERPAFTVAKNHPRRPITVYECDSCGARALGEQRCESCSTFMRKIGLGGECPSCGEALAVTELLAQEVTAAN
jgi:rubrerythrin